MAGSYGESGIGHKAITMWFKNCCVKPEKVAALFLFLAITMNSVVIFWSTLFGGIEIREEAVHITADGKKLWVIHGDYFDGVIQCAKWLAYVGDNLYELTLKLNRYLNQMRARMGMPYWSLSAYLKLKVKKAVNFISDFEVAVANEAKKRGYQGAICGHIHQAEIRNIDGILYCNDGDWVESCTALVEHADGRLEILRFNPNDTKQGLSTVNQPTVNVASKDKEWAAV